MEFLFNAKRVDSAKFGNEAHFMSFAAIIATRNGTRDLEFSYQKLRNTMTAIVEVSDNRLDKNTRGFPRPPLLTPDEGPSLKTSIFPLSFQVVREPLPFAYYCLKIILFLVCNQSLGMWPDNVSHPRRLDPTMELIPYSFVLYLQHGRHDVKCKPSIVLLK